jgi:hypothetical protein
MSIKAWLAACGAGAGVCAALASAPHVLREAPAGLDVAWTVSSSLGTYHLRGRFVLRGLNDGSSTSVSNESDPSVEHSHVDVQPGLYSLTLEDGFQLARVDTAASAPDVEDEPRASVRGLAGGEGIVASSLLSSNPLLVLALAGRDTAAGLALVAHLDEVASEATCVN